MVVSISAFIAGFFGGELPAPVRVGKPGYRPVFRDFREAGFRPPAVPGFRGSALDRVSDGQVWVFAEAGGTSPRAVDAMAGVV